MGIVYYLVSLICAWGAWWHYLKLYLEHEIPDPIERLMFTSEASNNSRMGNGSFDVIGWIRFLVWPYGIIQRTVLITKELKIYKLETNK